MSQQQQTKRRTYIIEPFIGEGGTPICDEEALDRLWPQLKGALMAVGGDVTIRADRVLIGELPGEPVRCRKCRGTGKRNYSGGVGACRACEGRGVKPGPPEILSETLGFVVRWEMVPALSEVPVTTRAMDHALAERGPDPEDEPDWQRAARDTEELEEAQEALEAGEPVEDLEDEYEEEVEHPEPDLLDAIEPAPDDDEEITEAERREMARRAIHEAALDAGEPDTMAVEPGEDEDGCECEGDHVPPCPFAGAATTED